jgi:TNF receptor-associated protein 1
LFLIKGFKFLNIENETDDFLNNLKTDDNTSSSVTKLSDDDITPYTLWIKNELEPYVSRVILSKRLSDTPILITSQVSATMKAMMAMMQQEKVNYILNKSLARKQHERFHRRDQPLT